MPPLHALCLETTVHVATALHDVVHPDSQLWGPEGAGAWPAFLNRSMTSLTHDHFCSGTLRRCKLHAMEGSVIVETGCLSFLHSVNIKMFPRAGETAQRLRSPAALAEDPTLVPSTDMEAHNHLQLELQGV